MNRRTYIKNSWLLLASTILPAFKALKIPEIITVTGAVASSSIGTTLIHEHILVDFSGAENYDPNKWKQQEVIDKIFPYLMDLKKRGCQTLVECTPAFLGRDVKLLQKLSALSGINIITNTGYYGAVDNKFFPKTEQSLSADELAEIWIKEFEEGIDGTVIRPGFMKISVNPGALSALHQKLVRAAAITHLKTGLTIASHTGPAIAAFDQIELLKQEGVHPSALIWVHAQGEADKQNYYKAAKEGTWISLDGLAGDNIPDYLKMLLDLKKAGFLSKALISHDAGYFDPNKEMGGSIRSYTTLFDKLLPLLKESKFSDKDIKQLLIVNPAEAFSIKVRKQ